ncbi:MAG: class I SAM-dependent methyltransferase [Oligoflexia bacterium]|nr:class I SAM-dependent methyltransferase [Oligoflexia bacterium]
MGEQYVQKPIALDAYEALAERYSELAETKVENGYIEHPAMRAQLGGAGEISGSKILDAGCGPGILSSYLVKHGAEVTGFDISPKMIALASKRLNNSGDADKAVCESSNVGKANFFIADLSMPLPMLADSTFDIVASSLAIDYVRDWSVPLREFWRVLKVGGRLVFSLMDPAGAFLWYKPTAAFGVQKVSASWSGFGGESVVVTSHYRPFEEVINPVIAAGFTLRKVVNMKPILALKEKNPEKFEEYNSHPAFMLIEAWKDRQN